jgi:sugar phosphate isomerase/epimerase
MATRREFLGASALAAALSAAGRSAQLKSIGVQLYTVRTIMPKNPEETLKAIRAIGYQEIEATFAGFDKLWPAVQASGLKPVSMHLDAKMVGTGGDELKRAIDQLAKYGFKYGVFPYVNPADRGGPEVMKALAGKLNAAGEMCRAAGMQCAYHNHAFEFESKDGTTLFQVLADNTDKKLVNFEVDLFWVSVAGNDPVEMLRKMKGRVPLVHLKDKAEGTPVMYKESVERTAFKEVGSGVLDWKAILKEAASVGVQHYFVEQDQTPGDPVESLRKSYGYLSALKY